MKIKTNTSAAEIIISILRRYWYITLLLTIAAAGSVAAGLIPPRIMKSLIDSYMAGTSLQQAAGTQQQIHSASSLTAVFIRIGISYLASFAVIAVLDIIKEAVLSMAGQKIAVTIRTTMMRKISTLPAQYFTSHESGGTVSRFTNDIEAVQDLFTNGVVSMIIDLLKIIGIVISMWLFSGVLGILMICVLPIVWLLTRFFQKRMLGAQKRKRAIVGRVTSFVPETMHNIRMIHSFGKEKYMKKKYAECISESYATIEKINWYDSIYSPVINVICALIIASVSLIASAHLPFALITAGIVAASIQYIIDVFTPIGNIGMELQSIQSAVAGINRIDEFLSEKEESEKDKNISSVLFKSINEGTGIHIDLNHVTFSYDANSRKILNDISLRIQPDEHIIFAGRTGAGKSTLFRLIPGLLVPNSGTVLVNGVSVSSIPNTQKRKLFGYVAQHFDFIEGTIADQITMGDKSISKEDIIESLRFTGLKEYVNSLEKGIDTKAEQRLFSQGQQQLLNVSRAIVTNPPVLLLDEITANLDSETEKQLLDVLEHAGKGRTVLSVSHRLSAQLSYDRIITVDDGKLY
jgi:ATP-binding cassette subfamily B protein